MVAWWVDCLYSWRVLRALSSRTGGHRDFILDGLSSHQHGGVAGTHGAVIPIERERRAITFLADLVVDMFGCDGHPPLSAPHTLVSRHKLGLER